MAINTANYFISAMLITVVSLDFTVGQTGVCYGRLGSNLPTPSQVVALYNRTNIRRMRIYDPYPPTLKALGNTNIELMLGVPNTDLPRLGKSQAAANSWVRANVTSYPNVRFRYISVGNEVDPASRVYAPYVLPAMQNIYNAISQAGLGGRIRVSTSIKTDVLEKSYPPSEGVFKSNVTSYLIPIIRFLGSTGAPLLVNVYTYFAYVHDMKNIKLEYALLEPGHGVRMPDGTFYDNLFYAILDAVHAAIERCCGRGAAVDGGGGDSGDDVEGVVSESGWPTKGKNTPSVEADGGGGGNPNTVENARIFNTNLMRVVKSGTPKRPGRPIETYIFAMFDENQKRPEYEKHFGIFRPNGNPKYPLRFY